MCHHLHLSLQIYLPSYERCRSRDAWSGNENHHHFPYQLRKCIHQKYLNYEKLLSHYLFPIKYYNVDEAHICLPFMMFVFSWRCTYSKSGRKQRVFNKQYLSVYSDFCRDYCRYYCFLAEEMLASRLSYQLKFLAILYCDSITNLAEMSWICDL